MAPICSSRTVNETQNLRLDCMSIDCFDIVRKAIRTDCVQTCGHSPLKEESAGSATKCKVAGHGLSIVLGFEICSQTSSDLFLEKSWLIPIPSFKFLFKTLIHILCSYFLVTAIFPWESHSQVSTAWEYSHALLVLSDLPRKDGHRRRSSIYSDKCCLHV